MVIERRGGRMLTKSRTKWGISILLAGILLALSLLGGKWGTTYAADNGVNAGPQIDLLDPDQIKAGSSETTIYIHGSGFANPNNGDTSHTAVRIKSNGTDQILQSLVYPTMIWTVVPSSMLTNPITYDISVVLSIGQTLPTIPITPYDVESTPVQLQVYTVQPSYLPFVSHGN